MNAGVVGLSLCFLFIYVTLSPRLFSSFLFPSIPFLENYKINVLGRWPQN